HADDRHRGHLRDEVHEVARGDELAVAGLEVDGDDDDADDDRQRAQLAVAYADPPLARRVGERLLRRGSLDGLQVVRGLDGRRRGAHARASSCIPGTCLSCPAVIASTISRCVVSVRLYSPTTPPSRRTEM